MKKRTTIWLEESLIKRLKIAAVGKDTTLTEIMAQALQEWLDRQEVKGEQK